MVRARKSTAVTLAIGDGANDVNMITEAHVGVGISGLEGQQAARSADYAIGQFRFLKDLLFFHGREAYRKNSFLVIYMFYKNILFVMPLFLFGFLNAFSGQTFYDKWLYQLYNVGFTAFPVMFFCILDREYERHVFQTCPHLYGIGLRNERFNTFLFWTEILRAFCIAGVILLFCFYGCDGLATYQSGVNGQLWASG
jgi:phospholipid-transporting ATPase